MEYTEGTLLELLRALLKEPNLKGARELEAELRQLGKPAELLGRINQTSSVQANSESDRGIAERLANAFDATLTAAREARKEETNPDLTPRKASQRYLCPNVIECKWDPQGIKLNNYNPPSLEFWEEDPDAKHRFRTYQPSDGLVTAMVADTGTGILRSDMSNTILELNSDDKLTTFEAIGQFGHGGSSTFAFCESALIITKPRKEFNRDLCYWTLVFPDKVDFATKQPIIRKWFSEYDKLPLVVRTNDIIDIHPYIPGTAIFHYGYHRSDWINVVKNPEQKNPWGRLARLFFSYPLPFVLQGQMARSDYKDPKRTLKGSFFRLTDKSNDKNTMDLVLPEKTGVLEINNVQYGTFSLFVFVLNDKSYVRNYVDPSHPVIFTLNGQNHGELTDTIITKANLSEISSTTVIEIRLDNLNEEALSNIINNSRELPKNTEFTKRIREYIIELLKSDEALQELEKDRIEDKIRKSNKELNKSISKFLSKILSDAITDRNPEGSKERKPIDGSGSKKPERIPPSEPPKILEITREKPLYVPQGSTRHIRFKSDARPPKYSFHGDNPRIFANLKINDDYSSLLTVTSLSDINDLGYGGITLECVNDDNNRITDKIIVGSIMVSLQSTDGNQLNAKVDIGVDVKQEPKQKVKHNIDVNITFHSPDDTRTQEIETLYGDNIKPFDTFLDKYSDTLGIEKVKCTYASSRHDADGFSRLFIEINAANESLLSLLKSCRTASERQIALERYLFDISLDSYQHIFSIDDLPTEIGCPILELVDDKKKLYADTHLNHEKAIRYAI